MTGRPDGRKEKTMTIKQATDTDIVVLAALAAKLWSGHGDPELSELFAGLVNSGDAACFIAYQGDRPVGFAQCQLRQDYVEGTETSPVGYLEGVFVLEAFRRQGFARELLAACEAWAKAVGCTEFASDCELDNEDSLRFHLKMGFAEANRVICFRKDL